MLSRIANKDHLDINQCSYFKALEFLSITLGSGESARCVEFLGRRLEYRYSQIRATGSGYII